MNSEENYISLLDLQTLLKRGISNIFPRAVKVSAEITSVSRKTNGHCYLELCQSGERGIPVAKARAVIWRRTFEQIMPNFYKVVQSEVQVGMKILADVRVSYHEVYGLSLNIDYIYPEYTLDSKIGEHALERQKTIERLEKEGLMELQKRVPTAELPYKLAVISAEGAAGLGDFSRHLLNNEYGFVFKPVLFSCSMQGESCPPSICEAFDSINEGYELRGEEYDAVLILRGGGSELDLSCFDDYKMAKAIALCPFPVYTAIGHERDFHVADMIARDYYKTPTALADAIVESFMAEDERISSFSSRLLLAFNNKIASMESTLALAKSQMRSALRSRLDSLSSSLDMYQMRLDSADPRKILKRGYALALDSSGKVLKEMGNLSKDDQMRIMFSDGTVWTKVVDLKSNNAEEKI